MTSSGLYSLLTAWARINDRLIGHCLKCLSSQISEKRQSQLPWEGLLTYCHPHAQPQQVPSLEWWAREHHPDHHGYGERGCVGRWAWEQTPTPALFILLSSPAPPNPYSMLKGWAWFTYPEASAMQPGSQLPGIVSYSLWIFIED